jgi:hypothetical protein
MLPADQLVAPLSGGTTGGCGGAGGAGGGVTGAFSALVHSPIAEVSFATMLETCRSLSVVCCSV